MEKIRLNKYFSDAGICSRREADRLVEAGRVTVDGRRAVLGERIEGTEEICVDGKPVKGGSRRRRRVVLVVNKPRGVICTTVENEHEPNSIVGMVDYPVRVYPVGRLDKDSEGLILMTDDGDLVNQILRARFQHEKEYLVRINRPVTEEFLKKMSGGVRILGTVTRPCRCYQTGEKEFGIVLTQGLNRQIRRMSRALGCEVKRLKRIRIMNIRLGELKPGEYRELTAEELETLRRLCAGDGKREKG